MKKIHKLLIKRKVLEYCLKAGMVDIDVTESSIYAVGEECELHIEFQHIYDLVLNGWELNEILANETNHKEKVG